jgi:ribosomal protein L11 methyltransferase
MSYPQFTFELRLSFTGPAAGATPEASPAEQLRLKIARQTKLRVMDWLVGHGVEEFVEGVMDGLDIDNEYTGPSQRDFYEELGGDLLPVSIYKYSRELLEDLRSQLSRQFPEGVDLAIYSMETKEWLEGWKESFKPIETEKFYIYPPWDDKNIPAGKLAIVVEPAMAFGTGQHATTQVVLRRLEALQMSGAPVNNWRCMDVGTGTGILALGAHKLGFKSVAGSDIDPDAVMAAKNNAEMNHIRLPIWQGSSPVRGVDGQAEFEPPFDVVVANILYVVLQKIIGELAVITRKGGLLILSGVLVDDGDEMAGLAAAEGMTLIDKGEQEGWACLTFVKK